MVKKLYPDDSRTAIFRPTNRWVGRWVNKHKVTQRRRTNSNNKSVADRLPKTKAFHKGLWKPLQEPEPASQSRRSPATAGARTTRAVRVLVVGLKRRIRTRTVSTGDFRWRTVQRGPGGSMSGEVLYAGEGINTVQLSCAARGVDKSVPSCKVLAVLLCFLVMLVSSHLS